MHDLATLRRLGQLARAGVRAVKIEGRMKNAAWVRQAVSLREIEGLSYEEIAIEMDCPIGTVRSRIFRAREAVAEKLRPLLDTAPDHRW